VPDKSIQLTIHITPEKADAREMAKLTQQLRQRLLRLDIEDVELLRVGEIPDRAKSGDPVTWGTLLLILPVPSDPLLTSVVDLVRSWLARNQEHNVILELDGDKLEITGLSSETEQKTCSDYRQ
jgi:hypothetical protein